MLLPLSILAGIGVMGGLLNVDYSSNEGVVNSAVEVQYCSVSAQQYCPNENLIVENKE